MEQKNKKNSGFTLIELSIVIVIIGLIVAGILGGQTLVRQAKIKSTMNQLQSFVTAINSFSLQYGGLPGDLTNAFDYWGTNCSNNDYECNGNGNKKIEHTDNPTDNEGLRAWQHLTLSKLLNGSYTGTSTTLGSRTACTPGVTNPKSSISGVGYFLHNWGSSSFNSINSGIAPTCSDPFLTPGELYQIDKKYDDANPRTGFIFSGGNTANACYSSSTLKYLLGNTENVCNLIYEIR